MADHDVNQEEIENEDEQLNVDVPEDEGQETDESGDNQQNATVDEFAIDIPDEQTDSPPEQQENSVIRKLRAELREKEAIIKRSGGHVQPVTQMPAKPTLEQCGYDEDTFSQKLEEWHDAKRKFESYENDIKSAQAKQEQRQQAVAQRYVQTQANLRAPDFKAKEELVEAALPEAFQQLLLNAADDSGKVVYFLGQSRKHLDELSKLADADEPIKFIKAVAALEGKITVNKRAKPAPDSSPRGGVVVASGGKTEDALRAEAQKTGDYTKLTAFKREQRKKK